MTHAMTSRLYICLMSVAVVTPLLSITQATTAHMTPRRNGVAANAKMARPMSDPRDDLGGAWPPPPLHNNPPDKPRKPRTREFHAESAICVLLGFLLGCGVTYLLMEWLATR